MPLDTIRLTRGEREEVEELASAIRCRVFEEIEDSLTFHADAGEVAAAVEKVVAEMLRKKLEETPMKTRRWKVLVLWSKNPLWKEWTGFGSEDGFAYDEETAKWRFDMATTTAKMHNETPIRGDNKVIGLRLVSDEVFVDQDWQPS